jgi:hypothetical protein
VSTPLTARALAGLHHGLLRGLVWLALLPLRATLALLVSLGIARVVASVAFVGWAQPVVGLRSAGWLVAIWWLHRLTRHQRAELYRHELLRRAERALERQPAALLHTAERALGRGVIALAGASGPPRSHPEATYAPVVRRRPALPPPPPAPEPAAGQPPEQTVAALGRYAADWVRRHLAHANSDTPTRRRWRYPQ